MFLNFLKDFFLKRKLRNSYVQGGYNLSSKRIENIGVLIDETYFSEKEALINSIIDFGFLESNIQILLFRNTIKKTDIIDFPAFSTKDLNWDSTFKNDDVNHFMSQKFDLLINYYDIEKAALMYVSYKSKASFKIGFSSIDKRINQLTITSTVENYQIFISELLRYLKILNKI